MSWFFIFGLLLIVSFGFSLSAYLSFYSFKLPNLFVKSLVFLVMGCFLSFLTFTVSLMIIWPSVM